MEIGKKYIITLMDADFPQEIEPFNIRVLDKDERRDILLIHEFEGIGEYEDIIKQLNFESLNSTKFYEANREVMEDWGEDIIIYYKKERGEGYTTILGFNLKFEEIKS